MNVGSRWARRALEIGCIAAALAFPSVSHGQAAQKSACVDLQMVLKQDPKYVEAGGIYEKEMKAYNDEVERLQKTFDSSLAAYQQQATVLSPSAKQAKETDLRNQQTKIQTRMSELQTKATQRERELIGPIEDRVKAVVDGIRAERNYTFIFDIARAGVISFDSACDITNLIIQRLKAGS